MLNDDAVQMMVDVLKKHRSKFAKEVAENVLSRSEGKTQARYELLKLWKELDDQEQE